MLLSALLQEGAWNEGEEKGTCQRRAEVRTMTTVFAEVYFLEVDFYFGYTKPSCFRNCMLLSTKVIVN